MDREKRADDRRLGRDAFQRETLLALQEATQDLARSSRGIYLHKSGALRGREVWTAVPAPLREQFQQAEVQVSILSSRVADDQVREHADSMLRMADVVRHPTDGETAAREWTM